MISQQKWNSIGDGPSAKNGYIPRVKFKKYYENGVRMIFLNAFENEQVSWNSIKNALLVLSVV